MREQISRYELRDVREAERQLESALSKVGWYRRCLEDIELGKIVRGLSEAEAGYHNALARFKDYA